MSEKAPDCNEEELDQECPSQDGVAPDNQGSSLFLPEVDQAGKGVIKLSPPPSYKAVVYSASRGTIVQPLALQIDRSRDLAIASLVIFSCQSSWCRKTGRHGTKR